MNCTFYAALGNDDRAYLLARAIQFFMPGIPQVYYVGLLAGDNDMALLARTGAGRDINRHYYQASEIESALQKPVVKELLGLIKLRNSHPAFNGEMIIEETAEHKLIMCWRVVVDNVSHETELSVDFAQLSYQIAVREVESKP